ncbi:MAG TPA: CAP domain-containing protein [Thermoanaerobaculia bacterium]|nr:CAP domain-containing protein [Thermoanaerobaculia bacterium]
MILVPILRSLATAAAVLAANAAYATTALPQAASAPPTARTGPSRPLPGAADLPELRRRLAAAIDAERRAAGVPQLRPSAPLDEVAQQRADEIGAKGALPDESESLSLFGRIQTRMVRAGYRPHLWTESVAALAGEPEAVVAWWKTSPDLAAAMRRELSDLGIGIGAFRGVPLYVFLFAWPEQDSWQAAAEPLHDLARQRSALLAAVNAARRAAGRPPLAADPRLDAAAQAHAEDMLARSYYSHLGPDGSSPRSRVESAGFPAGGVAENIAARHLSADAAMAGWMASSDHRRNILNPTLTSLGAGIAVGTYGHRYQVLWVLDLARPRP